MVSMKTKSALIADIKDLVGAVGDKFEADEDGDAERDFMAERCPPRLADAVAPCRLCPCTCWQASPTGR